MRNIGIAASMASPSLSPDQHVTENHCQKAKKDEVEDGAKQIRDKVGV